MFFLGFIFTFLVKTLLCMFLHQENFLHLSEILFEYFLVTYFKFGN